MNISGMIGSLDGVKHRMQDSIRRRIRAAAIGLSGALFILGAVGFGIAAAYIWLCTQLPDHQAALVVAGVLLVIGFIVIAASRSRNHPAPQPDVAKAAPDLARQADDAAKRAVQTAISQVRISPMSTVITAVALGAVVGLLRPSDDS